MPLSCRIVATCLDRTVNFYDMLTGEFVCRIAGLASPPTCVDCTQVSFLWEPDRLGVSCFGAIILTCHCIAAQGPFSIVGANVIIHIGGVVSSV